MPGIQEIDKIASQMASAGMLPVDRNIPSNDINNDYNRRNLGEQALAMMAIANKKDPQALLGMLAGQILNSGANAFANDYLRRGKIHKELEAASDEERAKMLEDLKKSNPDQYRRELKQFGLTEPAETPPATQPQPGNDAYLNRLAQGVLGDNNLLTNAADRQFESQPEVSAPFQDPQGVAQSAVQGAGNEEDFWQRYLETLQGR